MNDVHMKRNQAVYSIVPSNLWTANSTQLYVHREPTQNGQYIHLRRFFHSAYGETKFVVCLIKHKNYTHKTHQAAIFIICLGHFSKTGILNASLKKLGDSPNNEVRK